MQPASLTSANELFRQYLAATEPDHDPEDLLGRLIVEFAQPLVGRVVRRRLASSRGVNAEDVEDVASDALMSLVVRLRTMRVDAATVRVDDFEGYAAGLASHVAFQFFASRFPERSRLRTRLRYVLTTDSRFRIVRSEHGASVCSLASKGEGGPVAPPAIEEGRKSLARRALPSQRLPDTLLAVLTEIPGGIELSDLTTLIAGLLGVEDRNENPDNLAETLPDPRASQSRDLELKQTLAALWREIDELPVGQRVALLLNLRSTSGACIWLLPELGVVGFRELATSLGMTAEGLAGIWNRLPLDDAEIAGRLGLQRQQVINMRSAARQRLTRRTKIRDKMTAASNMPDISTTI